MRIFAEFRQLLARTVRSDAQLSSVRLVLLTSVGWYGRHFDARQADVDDSVSKPVRKFQLYNCLVKRMPMPAGSESPLSAPPSSHAQPEAQWDAHILLAEDNLVNQQLATYMLTGMGCRVTRVVNGYEALHAIRHAPYDLVLMDCQMPEMDGFSATQAIRQHLASTGEESPPIIALTASALHGDRERCLDAGMDGYLSKPIRSAELYALLDRELATGPADPDDYSQGAA